MADWTQGRINAFITSVLRSGSKRWPPKYECLEAAKTEKKVNPASGRFAQFYKCAMCQQDYVAKAVEVDHIVPIVDPKVGFTTWDAFIKGLFCSISNLQVLCITCHKKKSKEEKV